MPRKSPCIAAQPCVDEDLTDRRPRASIREEAGRKGGVMVECLTLLAALWTAAGILVAFRAAAFTLRINREISVGEAKRITWLPLADWINVVSIAATLLGVFVAQALKLAPQPQRASPSLMRRCFWLPIRWPWRDTMTCSGRQLSEPGPTAHHRKHGRSP